jgi:glycosyltransferase involved in cell wall biosynthesis
VQDVLAASHVYAFPSWTEAFPNGLIEGMAAGLPVVATSTGGMVELIEDGVNGLLVPPGDAGALATALLDLMRKPDLSDRLGSAARSTIETRYSFERMIREFDGLYGSASSGSPSRCVA